MSITSPDWAGNGLSPESHIQAIEIAILKRDRLLNEGKPPPTVMARLVDELRDVGFSVNLACSVLKVRLPLLERTYLSAFGARVDRQTLLKEIGTFHASCSADVDPQVVARPRTPPRRPARGPFVARDRSSRQLLPTQARSPRRPRERLRLRKAPVRRKRAKTPLGIRHQRTFHQARPSVLLRGARRIQRAHRRLATADHINSERVVGAGDDGRISW